MGTKGSYTGGGGSAGKTLRKTIDNWLDALPPTPSSPPNDKPDRPDDHPPLPRLRPEQLLPAIGLFRPASGGHADGPRGGGGGVRAGGSTKTAGRGGGAQRSASRSASTAGRAAAAAYGLRTGDAALLRDLGLDYESLRANADPIDVSRHIVNAACGGPLSDGTIEDEERRAVAAQVAEWVLEANADGVPPTPEEVVRETIALIIFEAVSNETAARLRNGERPAWASREAERELRATAQALAVNAPLTATGPTAEEFSRAIEEGIEAMRAIWGGS